MLATRPVTAGKVGRAEYVERLAGMHYVCMPYGAAHYRYSPSGVLADALALARPILAFDLPIFRDLFDRFGDIGHLCRNAEEMAELIRLAVWGQKPVSWPGGGHAGGAGAPAGRPVEERTEDGAGGMIMVLFSTFNGADTLPAMLESLTRLTPPPGGWKLVAVDNGSTDGSGDLLRSFPGRLPLTVLSEPAKGKNRALNRGLEIAKGDLVVLTDDDIIAGADWLSAWASVADRLEEFLRPGRDVRRLPAIRRRGVAAGLRLCGKSLRARPSIVSRTGQHLV